MLSKINLKIKETNRKLPCVILETPEAYNGLYACHNVYIIYVFWSFFILCQMDIFAELEKTLKKHLDF